MLYEVKIRLTSAWLGSIRRGNNRIRRFPRGTDDSTLAFDLPAVQWTFQQAANALHLKHVDVRCIRLEEGFKSPTLQSYKRRYRAGKDRQEQSEIFEAMPSGMVLTIPVFITGEMEEESMGRKPPTQKEFEQILTMVGKMLGLSPWGNHFGYGRFTVEEIKEQ